MKSITSFFKNLSSLEKLELAVIALFLVNGLLVDITFTPKPLLQKLLNLTTAPLPSPLAGGKSTGNSAGDTALENQVLPPDGVALPATWGDLGRQLVDSGVIDQTKFEQLYSQKGELAPEIKKVLLEGGNGRIKITRDNSGFWLNMLWALGLGNKNDILDNGEMQDPQFGGAQNFASTGGWTASKGDVMQHYSKHSLVQLTAQQQALVDRVSRNIYRPCCGNSTHFPDCNHGMAMLGLLELMASQGVNEQEMYKAALVVNSYWFPETYLTIAKYFQDKETGWAKIDAPAVLGQQYSSAQGYRQLLNKINPVSPSKGGSGCSL